MRFASFFFLRNIVGFYQLPENNENTLALVITFCKYSLRLANLSIITFIFYLIKCCPSFLFGLCGLEYKNEKILTT